MLVIISFFFRICVVELLQLQLHPFLFSLIIIFVFVCLCFYRIPVLLCDM